MAHSNVEKPVYQQSGIKSQIKLKTVDTKEKDKKSVKQIQKNSTKTAVHQINEPDHVEPKLVDKSMNKNVGVVLPPKEKEQ